METEEGGRKSALYSKTIHFNWISSLASQAVIPFLPHKYQASPYIVSAVCAWFTIGNIALRFATRQALTLFKKKGPDEKSEGKS